LRHERITPLTGGIAGGAGRYRVLGNGVLAVQWRIAPERFFTLRLNLSSERVPAHTLGRSEVVACEPSSAHADVRAGGLPRHTAACCIQIGSDT
jgi:hypothetical protein